MGKSEIVTRVQNDSELSDALGTASIDHIVLNYAPDNFLVERLVTIDLNGHNAGEIMYKIDDKGTMSLINTAEPATITTLNISAPEATFNVGSNITLTNQTVVQDVAVGTFNTEATHLGLVEIKDANGGSVNFTGATIGAGIEITPDQEATDHIIIRGEKPEVTLEGDATVRIKGINPKVLLEGQTNDLIIEAVGSEFHLAETGNATNITVARSAVGSTITASKYYEFELLFNEGDTVGTLMESGLFGDKLIRVVGYPSELNPIEEAYLLKLDGHDFSTVYRLEEKDLSNDINAVTTNDGKLLIDTENLKLYYSGTVTGVEAREYLENLEEFKVPTTFLDGKVVLSFYDIKSTDELLSPSDSTDNSMRVLVGTDQQHGLYILTKTEN